MTAVDTEAVDFGDGIRVPYSRLVKPYTWTKEEVIAIYKSSHLLDASHKRIPVAINAVLWVDSGKLSEEELSILGPLSNEVRIKF